jgi:hypothetical protein
MEISCEKFFVWFYSLLVILKIDDNTRNEAAIAHVEYFIVYGFMNSYLHHTMSIVITKIVRSDVIAAMEF